MTNRPKQLEGYDLPFCPLHQSHLRRIESFRGDFGLNIGVIAYVLSTLAINDSENCGRLFHAWILFQVDVDWFPSRVWEAERPASKYSHSSASWMLVDWGSPIVAMSGDLAVQRWLEKKNRNSIHALKSCISTVPKTELFQSELFKARQEQKRLADRRKMLTPK